jgi:hypothetical protein
MDFHTKDDLRKVSDSMLGVAQDLVEWRTAHFKLEVLLITDPWHDVDGQTRRMVDEMNEAAKQIKMVGKNLKKICDYFDVPFPHPEIGEADEPDRVVKYALKLHERAEEMLNS